MKVFYKTALLSIFCAMGASLSAQGVRQPIDTRNNTVGIGEDDSCTVAWVGGGDITPAQYVISCKSGKAFRNVAASVSSSTGTPGYLMYSNYIGTQLLSKGTMPGAGQRLNYCKGTCE